MQQRTQIGNEQLLQLVDQYALRNLLATHRRGIDRFSKRDGIWKYDARSFVLDWVMEQDSSDASDSEMLAGFVRGSKHPKDPVYELWKQ